MCVHSLRQCINFFFRAKYEVIIFVFLNNKENEFHRAINLIFLWIMNVMYIFVKWMDNSFENSSWDFRCTIHNLLTEALIRVKSRIYSTGLNKRHTGYVVITLTSCNRGESSLPLKCDNVLQSNYCECIATFFSKQKTHFLPTHAELMWNLPLKSRDLIVASYIWIILFLKWKKNKRL